MLGGIRRALEDADGIEVAGTTHRGNEVVALVEDQLPDVVLLNHLMPGLKGPETLKLLAARHPQIKLVMLSASEDPAHIAEALHAGAAAYIGKRIDPRDLASALRQIVEGVVHQAGSGVCGAVPAAAVEADVCAHDLTPRELTMLEAIAQGTSTKAISRDLWISEKTVKFHLTNIYRKLGVHNRTGAMQYAYRHKLIPAPSRALREAATA